MRVSTKMFHLVLLFGLSLISATASATVVYSDLYDPEPDILLGGWGQDTLSWSFNITDDGYVPGISDPITSAYVDLTLLDDKYDPWHYRYEYAKLFIGDQYVDYWEVDSGTSSFQVESLVTLTDLGTLDVTLKAVYGDFVFQRSELTAYANPVPVPAAVWLFGSGLLALVGASKHKQ